MIKEEKVHSILQTIRSAYIVFYLLVVGLAALIPFRLLADGHMGFIYNLIAITGFIILLFDFFTKRILFKNKGSIWLIIFLAAYGLSCIMNIKYGYMDNAKTFIWTAVQFFVLTAFDDEVSDRSFVTYFSAITESIIILWTAAVTWSLWQFITMHRAEYWLMDNVTITREGFVDERLFGIFTDPNYASLCSIAIIAFAIINMIFRKGVWSKVFHITVIVLQYLYIVLSGSRTSEYSLMIAVGLFGMFIGWQLIEGKKPNIFRQLCMGLVLCIVFSAAVWGSFKAIKAAAIYVPHTYSQIVSANNADTSGEENAEQDTEEIEAVPNDDASEQTEETPQNTEEAEMVSFDRYDVNSDNILNNRTSIWKDYIEVFKTTPIWGTSPRNAMKYTMDHFDNLYIIEKQYSVHNSYLSVLVCMGIAGAIPTAVWMIIQVVYLLAYLITRRNSKDKYYAGVVCLFLLLAVFAISAFPVMFIFYNNMISTVLFWLTIGFASAFVRKSNQERKETEQL